MLKEIEGCFCTIAEGLREYWCRDPYLRSEIPAEKFVTDGFTNTSLTPPYVVYRQTAAANNRKLGDHFYFDIVSASLRIYAVDEAWQMAKQCRVLYSNMGHLESLEGDVCGINLIRGGVVRLPNGINVVENILRMRVYEYRGPERLRMVNNGTRI